MESSFDAKRWLSDLATETRDSYARNRRVMSFGEYLSLFVSDPVAQTRCAAEYLRDCYDHFGSSLVKTARGEARRFHLFDSPWEDGHDRLMGQEEVQGAVYRLISNFAREGYTNRLILLHGPNGSAKSTFISCIQRALEHYSMLDQGTLYRINWIFPVQKLVKGGIGFGERTADLETASDSYAQLEEELIEAKLTDELKDHPLLLIPKARRRALIESLLADKIRDGFRPSKLLMDGDLSPRNRQIFETLLVSNHGDLGKVMRHVQVERYYISRRYRQGVATVGPQLAVDAAARPMTMMGRNISGLPPALQALPLFEYMGELVDGNRGLVEFADLLKRPLDAFKYLLGTVEGGQVALDVANLQIDTVFLASSNEGYLAAFKEIPEFQSFKGRMELVRAPYLLDHRVEQQIYEAHIAEVMANGTRHVAPHLAWAAGLWAVLTRMRKPMVEKYPKQVADLVGRLGPLDKALLYAGEEPVEGFTHEQMRDLRSVVEKIARESDNYPNYEGRTGASPREMKMLLMNAAQNPRYRCASPFALFEELEELVKGVTVYEFLKQEPLSGGYHEHRKFIFQVRDRLIDKIDHEVRISMGLVEESRYLEQYERYVTQVSYWVKGEKVPNPVTGAYEPPNEDFMSEIERVLDVGGSSKREEFRREVIAKIGAWSVDHPKQRPDFEQIFPGEIEKLRDAFYSEHKKQVRKINEDLLTLMSEGAGALQKDAAVAAERTLNNLKSRFGYCDDCAKEAVLVLVRNRYV